MTEEEKKLRQQQEQQNTPAPEVQQNTAAPSAQQTVQTAPDEGYNQAMGALEANKKTGFVSSYDGQISDLFQQIMNRDKFSYDINSDAVFQSLVDNYTNLGRMAMKDTMGQAAALTGGYGSSYGQAVGQQQYDRYLQDLMGYVPELYGEAYDRYQAEGNALMQQIGIAGELADDEYGKFLDDRDTNYGRLMELMNATGYMPTPEEIEAAGMTQPQVDSILQAWKIKNPELYEKMYGSINSPSGSGGGNYDPNIANTQRELGVPTTGRWDSATQAAWEKKYGNGGDGGPGEMATSSKYLPIMENIYNNYGASRAQDALEHAISENLITAGEYNYIVEELNKKG